MTAPKWWRKLRQRIAFWRALTTTARPTPEAAQKVFRDIHPAAVAAVKDREKAAISHDVRKKAVAMAMLVATYEGLRRGQAMKQMNAAICTTYFFEATGLIDIVAADELGRTLGEYEVRRRTETATACLDRVIDHALQATTLH